MVKKTVKLTSKWLYVEIIERQKYGRIKMVKNIGSW